jgi:mannitol/fructose-specific phosphotransferase system IIA component (Ntr-type)
MDGKPMKIAIVLIITEDKSGEIHLEVLIKLARKLMYEYFKKSNKSLNRQSKNFGIVINWY